MEWQGLHKIKERKVAQLGITKSVVHFCKAPLEMDVDSHQKPCNNSKTNTLVRKLQSVREIAFPHQKVYELKPDWMDLSIAIDFVGARR